VVNADAARAAERRTPVTTSGEFRVWWVPQVPMQPFLVSVSSLAEAVRLLDALAEYDLFQVRHNIKPDYVNAGGVQFRHPAEDDNIWFDIDPDDEDDVLLINSYGGGCQ